MKANFQKLSSKSHENSLVDFWVRANAFGFHWHYHPEVEICYVKQGSGKRIIGSSIENFEAGDLVLVGSNVPHSWITDEQFNNSSNDIEVFVVQFSLDVFQRFMGMPEFHRVEQLLSESTKGLYFKRAEKYRLVELLLRLPPSSGMSKFLRLLELLEAFCDHNETVPLNPGGYTLLHKKHQEERILKVCHYIHEKFKEEIRISDLATLVAMNNASFCRFFKRTLGKTVVEYINEIRIDHVCNQIRNTKDPIYRIAYDTGFSSIAHFNKQFKRIMDLTPTEYRDILG